MHSAHKKLTQYFMSDSPTLRLLCLEPAHLDAIYQLLCQLSYALGASFDLLEAIDSASLCQLYLFVFMVQYSHPI